jgi:hypothetical protein
MLADEIAADKIITEAHPGIDKIQAKILAAQKFSLESDFALAADGLTDNLRELEKIAPFCRLPYPLCWFEVAQADRKHWIEAPIHYPILQSAPSRIGFLMESYGDLSHWRTFLCWSIKNYKVTPNNISPMIAVYDTRRAIKQDLADLLEFYMAPFDCGIPENLQEQYFNTLVRSDWAGEIRFIFAVLGLLNTRNVPETQAIEYNKLNKHRAKSNKFPLSSHTVLKIRAVHRRSLTGYGSGASHAEIRSHFVRGHFKTRRTGAFWWGPHMRGKREHGFVSKDYTIE